MKKQKVKKDIVENVHAVIGSEEGANGGRMIRVVSWIIDGGNETARVLEKREYYLKNGTRLMGKAKGFNKKDLNLITDKWDTIEKAMA